MADLVKVKADDFLWASEKLARMDKPVRLAYQRAARKAMKPVGDQVLEAIATAMPKRGGLSERIRAQGKVGIIATVRSGAGVRIVNQSGMMMGAFETGLIRHPVFGRWLAGQKPQKVPAGTGKAEFQKREPEVLEAIADAATAAVWKEIHR